MLKVYNLTFSSTNPGHGLTITRVWPSSLQRVYPPGASRGVSCPEVDAVVSCAVHPCVRAGRGPRAVVRCNVNPNLYRTCAFCCAYMRVTPFLKDVDNLMSLTLDEVPINQGQISGKSRARTTSREMLSINCYTYNAGTQDNCRLQNVAVTMSCFAPVATLCARSAIRPTMEASHAVNDDRWARSKSACVNLICSHSNRHQTHCHKMLQGKDDRRQALGRQPRRRIPGNSGASVNFITEAAVC